MRLFFAEGIFTSSRQALRLFHVGVRLVGRQDIIRLTITTSSRSSFPRYIRRQVQCICRGANTAEDSRNLHSRMRTRRVKPETEIRAFYLYSSFAGIRISVENGSVRALSLFE